MHVTAVLRTALATAALTASSILALPASAATLAAPKLTVHPGAVTVSWTAVAGHPTYTVRSAVPGESCVTAQTSCTINVTSPAPVSFTVTTSGATRTSAPSKVLIPHLVLVVAGQSNAMGAESYAVDPTTHTNYLAAPYTNGADANDTLSWEPWFVQPQPTKGWIPLDTPQSSIFNASTAPQVFGPEIGLARQLWADSPTPISIFKAAFPDTSLAVNWAPSGPIYPRLVKDVNARFAADAKAGQLDVLGTLYWYQGESDAMTPAYAQAYQANLTTLLANLSSDLPWATPHFVLVKESLAAVIAMMNVSGTCASCAATTIGDAQVRAADDAVAVATANTVTVDSLGYPRNGLQIHLSNTSELALGAAMAKASEPWLGLSSLVKPQNGTK